MFSPVSSNVRMPFGVRPIGGQGKQRIAEHQSRRLSFRWRRLSSIRTPLVRFHLWGAATHNRGRAMLRYASGKGQEVKTSAWSDSSLQSCESLAKKVPVPIENIHPLLTNLFSSTFETTVWEEAFKGPRQHTEPVKVEQLAQISTVFVFPTSQGSPQDLCRIGGDPVGLHELHAAYRAAIPERTSTTCTDLRAFFKRIIFKM